MTARPEHLFPTGQLVVGDLWPQRWLRCHGPIVAMEPYHGPPCATWAIARFADGQGIALDHDSLIPVATDELAEWWCTTRRTRGPHPGQSELPVIVTHELQICTGCLLLIGDGAYDDTIAAAAAARCGEGLVERWGNLAGQLVPGLADPCGCRPDEDCECPTLGHQLAACDGCGDEEPGDRFAAVILDLADGVT